jgi:hypothetical protein
MASRLCGYCRREGHRADTCEEKAAVRKDILTYVPQQRKEILDLMAQKGFGQGATFVTKDYWSGESITNIIVDASFISKWQFGVQKNIKYSKQLRFTRLSPINRNPDGSIADIKYQYDRIHIETVTFGKGNADTHAYGMYVRDILASVPYTGQALETNRCYLIEPSYDRFDIDPHMYIKYIAVNRRVATDLSDPINRWDNLYYATGIMPAGV